MFISKQMILENSDAKEKYDFHCQRWLATDEDDRSLIREMPAEGKGITKPLPCKEIVIVF